MKKLLSISFFACLIILFGCTKEEVPFREIHTKIWTPEGERFPVGFPFLVRVQVQGASKIIISTSDKYHLETGYISAKMDSIEYSATQAGRYWIYVSAENSDYRAIGQQEKDSIEVEIYDLLLPGYLSS